MSGNGSPSGGMYQRSPNASLYPPAYRSAFLGNVVYDPSFALANDPNLYQKIKRDPIVKQAVDHRTRAVAQHKWQLKPASEDPKDVALARVLEFLVRRTRRLTRALRQLAEAFLLGSAWQEIQGDFEMVRPPGFSAPVRLWVPQRLEHIDRRMFRREVVTSGGERTVVWKMATAMRQSAERWVVLDGQEGRKDLRNFLCHVYDADHDTFGYGRGLIEAVYWYYFAKQIAFREGLQGLQRWAQGWVVFRSANDQTHQPDDDNATFITDAIQEIETHEGRHILGIDKEDELQVFSGPSTGHEQVKFWLSEYLDPGITRLLTGANLPLGGSSDVGSNARSQTEERTLDLVTQGDQEDLADTLTSDFVPVVHAVNASQLDALGLGGGQLPSWEFTQDTVNDPVKNSTVIETAARVGVEVDPDDLYDKLGLKRPAAGKGIRLAPSTSGLVVDPLRTGGIGNGPGL